MQNPGAARSAFRCRLDFFFGGSSGSHLPRPRPPSVTPASSFPCLLSSSSFGWTLQSRTYSGLMRMASTSAFAAIRRRSVGHRSVELGFVFLTEPESFSLSIGDAIPFRNREAVPKGPVTMDRRSTNGLSCQIQTRKDRMDRGTRVFVRWKVGRVRSIRRSFGVVGSIPMDRPFSPFNGSCSSPFASWTIQGSRAVPPRPAL